VADLIGGVQGAIYRANVEDGRCRCLLLLHDMAAAAQAACSSLRAARASGSRTALVTALSVCDTVAENAPCEMVTAERESRDQERLTGSPSYGGLDLSQEGRVSLPTTPAALFGLGLAYNEAAVAICDVALAAVGGRGSPAADDNERVPHPCVEAQARGHLGVCLNNLGEEPQRSYELLRQAVALRRQVLRTVAPGDATQNAQRMLADQLATLVVVQSEGSDGMAEAEACLREALALGDLVGDVFMTAKILQRLINLCGEAHATVGRAEADVFHSRLNRLYPVGKIARPELLDLPRASRAAS